MNSPAFHRSISQNGSISKDHGHALKKFFVEMRAQKFDDIKLATYRCAAKLYYVQKSTNLHLVDIYNIIEAFRENALNTLDHAAEIDEARLESIIQSIYFTLYKRLSSTKHVDLEKCIVLLSQWIMHAYDTAGLGRIQVLSVKTALSSLCEGRLIDKFRYVFTQISESDGTLNTEKLDQYLKCLLVLPSAVGEEANFGYNSQIIDSCLTPTGNLKRKDAKIDEFLDEFMNIKDTQSGALYWLHMLNKLSKSAYVTHATGCKACGKQGFTGLRYKCGQCYNYNICQECFWREKSSTVKSSHKADHTMKEHLTWGNKGDRGTSVKKKLLCSPTKSGGQKLPDYPKEPEPNKTLDMSNIVPAIPSQPNTPNSTLNRAAGRMMNGSVSHHSNLSTLSRKFSQDNIQKHDDEHRLISLYAQRLATDKLNENLPNKTGSLGRNSTTTTGSLGSSVDNIAVVTTTPLAASVEVEVGTLAATTESSSSSASVTLAAAPVAAAPLPAAAAALAPVTPEQKEMLSSLEEKNRVLLQEIKQLKAEHEEATKNAQQMGAEQMAADPKLLTELRVLRQRKDELEMRMSALQETRRELMVQLEGLMKLLKNTEPTPQSQPQSPQSPQPQPHQPHQAEN